MSVNHTNITKLLLKYKAEVNHNLKSFNYAEMYHKYNLRYLFDKERRWCNSPLFYAYNNGNLEATNLLIENNAIVEEKLLIWNSGLFYYKDTITKMNIMKIYEILLKSYMNRIPNNLYNSTINKIVNEIDWDCEYSTALHEIFLNNGAEINIVKEYIKGSGWGDDVNSEGIYLEYFFKYIDEYVKEIKIKQILTLILCCDKNNWDYNQDIFIKIYSYLEYHPNMVKKLNLEIDMTHHSEFPPF